MGRGSCFTHAAWTRGRAHAESSQGRHSVLRGVGARSQCAAHMRARVCVFVCVCVCGYAPPVLSPLAEHGWGSRVGRAEVPAGRGSPALSPLSSLTGLEGDVWGPL